MMKKWSLTLIFLLALILRLYHLGSTPYGFTPDEASFGYDAYSLLKTGKDQWGHSFPLVLESFGDFKPPLYAYLLTPFVGVFGLQEWVVRLPNALLGALSTLALYYLVLEIPAFATTTGLIKKSSPKINHKALALVAAFLMAISPWHVMMSRGAFEANLTNFLLPFGIYGFLRGLRDKNWFVIAGLSLGLNMFSYHSARVVTPLVVGIVGLMYLFDCRSFRETLQKIKRASSFIIIFGVFCGLALYSFQLGAGARAADISVLAGAAEEAAAPRLEAINAGTSPFIAKVLHNQYNVAFDRFTRNYVQYFSPQFLFFDGPAEATYGMIPGKGVLYVTDIFLLMGALIAIWELKRKKEIWIFVAWLLIAPVPAALAQGVGYAGNRSVVMLPALIILLSLGLNRLAQFEPKLTFIKSKRDGSMIAKSLLTLTILFSISYFGIYFARTQEIHARAMLSGRRDMMELLAKHEDNYQTIVMSRSLSEPHMYVAFYKTWDIEDYQAASVDWQRYKSDNLRFLDQLGQYRLGKYWFTSLENEDIVLLDNYLLVGKPEEFEAGIQPLEVITYPDGEDAIYIVDPDKTAYAQNIN